MKIAKRMNEESAGARSGVSLLLSKPVNFTPRVYMPHVKLHGPRFEQARGASPHTTCERCNGKHLS
jgi:hypothetical protein